MEENGGFKMKYLKAKTFSNNKLKLYYNLLPDFLILIENEKENFRLVCEKLKDKISRPYHKALIKATIINEYREVIYDLTSGVELLRPPRRDEFRKKFEIPNKCQGCLREPIQEEAHIIQKAQGKNIKNISNYLHHYANLWLLCGTCHNIVDKKNCWNDTSEKLKEKFLSNLGKRKDIDKKMYELLRDDRMFIKKKRKKIELLLKMSSENVVQEFFKLKKKEG